MDLVEMTQIQKEDNYKKRQFKRNKFTVRLYIMRNLNFTETKEIPLENRVPITDSRISDLNHKLDEDTLNTDNTKMQKNQENSNFATTSKNHLGSTHRDQYSTHRKYTISKIYSSCSRQ